MLKSLVKNRKWIFILTMVWVVLVERLDIQTVLIGVGMSLAALFVTEKYITGFQHGTRYPFRARLALSYGGFLLKEIYAAGISTLRLIINGRINPGTVRIQTALQDPLLIAILANSITLTPGTVTVEVSGRELTVLWLDMEPGTPEQQGLLIKGKLEEKLMKWERSGREDTL